MSLRINHNISAMNTHRQLLNTDRHLSASLEKLSSGLRINRAADDSAGLAISQRLRSQIDGLKMASQNADQAKNMVQTAEGFLGEKDKETGALIQPAGNLVGSYRKLVIARIKKEFGSQTTIPSLKDSFEI